MIEILRATEVAKSLIMANESHSRRFVTANSTWVAYPVPENAKWFILTVSIPKENIIAHKGIGYILDGVTYILAIKGVDYNSLYYAGMNSQENIEVPKTTTIGYFDQVYRTKHLVTPFEGYWDNNMLPIVIHKQKRR